MATTHTPTCSASRGLGPLFVPGLTWELDSIVEWGDRATDKVRAAAVFATATHAFNPDQSVLVGYHQGTGHGRRGGGTTHLYDTLYSSGFNNYGYMGLSKGRNIGDVRIGGRSKIKGPASLLWGYHEQFLSVRQDQRYAIFTPTSIVPAPPRRCSGARSTPRCCCASRSRGT